MCIFAWNISKRWTMWFLASLLSLRNAVFLSSVHVKSQDITVEFLKVMLIIKMTQIRKWLLCKDIWPDSSDSITAKCLLYRYSKLDQYPLYLVLDWPHGALQIVFMFYVLLRLLQLITLTKFQYYYQISKLTF